MLFNSLEYLLFFPLVLLVTHCLPRKARHVWLLAASYYFYMCWNVSYALLMLASTLVTWLCGLGVERLKAVEGSRRAQKAVIALGLAACLGILFFFKYFNFAADLVGSVIGLTLKEPVFDVLLPVGISFYTFQALGYMIDVYRGRVAAERSILRYALFISFFPQLVAGPIERSENMLTQHREPARFSFHHAMEGTLLMLWGYFLKVVLADRIAIFVDHVYAAPAEASGMALLVATLLFAVQIYCDFYGYSVIAIGSARILGIRLMENFDTPYFSASVADFWRRWHVSLTSWFKDYLYIPLGGSRKGTLRKYLNKLIVFLASGLWHGASLTFVIWGGINGLYQIIGEALAPAKERLARALHVKREWPILRLFAIATTFLLVDFTWIFFRAATLEDAATVIRTICTDTHISSLTDGSLLHAGLDLPQMILLLGCILLLVAADLFKRRGVQIHRWIANRVWLRWVCIAVAAFFILLFGIWGPSYDQASFIYFQF